MLVTEARPRNLRWFHAGPLLYGDWGTSRLYVLGLAFFFTAHASIVYLALIGVLMIAVSWAYTVVCRCFPDGGGVYTAARRLHPVLSVVGATLLLCGYIITAAISAVEAAHYVGVPEEWTFGFSGVVIVLLGMVNYFGARSAGRLALVIAFAALAVSGVLAIGVVFLTPFFWNGVREITLAGLFDDPWEAWVNFTSICLALAGVEAVANMTGLMRPPVARTSRRTIWPVSAEVVGLNVVFGIALTGLAITTVGGRAMVDIKTPDADRQAAAQAAFLEKLPEDLRAEAGTGEGIRLGAEALAGLPPALAAEYESLRRYGREVDEYKNAAMKVIARDAATHVTGNATAGLVFGKAAGVTFGLLLLSATNTVIMAMVSVLFAMAQDRELPRPLTRLNYSGVPWVGLIVAVLAPIAVLALERDVARLAELYVIGVCGAITTNILCCAVNRSLDISRGERAGMWGLGLFLLAITLTIAGTKANAALFAGGVVGLALATRGGLRLAARGRPEPLAEPAYGWLAEVRRTEVVADPKKPRIMLAARGRHQAEFAVDLARRRGATLFVIFVRPLRVIDFRPGSVPDVTQDRDAQEALGTAVLIAKANAVPVVPIYVAATEIAPEILDYTVTYGCDTLIMGKSRRSPLRRRLEGDVVTQVAEHLPDEVALITRSADTPHASRNLVIPTPTTGRTEPGEDPTAAVAAEAVRQATPEPAPAADHSAGE